MTYSIQDSNILPYIPKRVTSWAMLTYVAAILCCNILFASHMLYWQWWFFGAIEVLGFFYFANRLSKGWFYLKPLHFTQKLFWMAFFLRVLWVVISYTLYQKWTGTAFSIDAGDELDLDIKNGILKNITKGTVSAIEPLPDVMIKLLEDGGLIEHIKKNGDLVLG